MPYGLKMALLGLLTFIASLTFDTRNSGTIGVDPNPSPQGIYPNGGSDPPGGG
jgi:hypothetical protein